MSLRRRVFVRGVGAVSSLGTTWPETAAALAAGKSAIGPLSGFDWSGFPCRVGAAMPMDPTGSLDRRASMAMKAGQEAWGRSGIGEREGTVGIFIGAEAGRAPWKTTLRLAHAAGPGPSLDPVRFAKDAWDLASEVGESRVSPAAVASALAGAFAAQGPVETISIACASGLAAIAEGARAVRQGSCDVALCGGVGADADPLMIAAFGLLGALSAQGKSCPFDSSRDGFVIGEGAAAVVLAAQRGSSRVELAGVGRSLDAGRLTAPAPDGSGAIRAMRAALKDADCPSVDYVQAHGTSTVANDAIEAGALREVLGSSLSRGHVSSVKGALGHWIAGAGALGFLCAVEAILEGTVFPTAGLVDPDPACALPHVIGASIDRQVDTALCNAFAFGGANTSVVVRSCR